MPDPHRTTLPEGHAWLRVADASWTDPLNPTYADDVGGRWNAPGDGPTLYLCENIEVARAQLRRLLAPTPVDPSDLAADAPYVLVTALLPSRQQVADAFSDTGLRALGLPTTYPKRRSGAQVAWSDCRRSARRVRAANLRGILARSAWPVTGGGRELAWFPALRAHARAVGQAQPFASWH
jgi:hypothetical protein